ncbi:Fructokinase-like 2, chloroplastic-like protein [Drosera capensis]
MCSLSSTHFLSLPRWNTNLRHFGTAYHIKVLDIRLRRWHVPSSSSRNQVIVSVASSEAVDDKGAVPKRKRGRPRKETIAPRESNRVTLVSGDAVGVTEAASAPIKRGRGRPRKVSPQAQSDIEKKEEEKIKKEPRRGRKSAGVGQGITTKAAMASTSVVEEDLGKALGSKDSKVDSVAVTNSTFIDEAKIGKTESKDAKVDTVVEEEMNKKSKRKSKTEDTNVDSHATKVVPSNGEGADDVDDENDDITLQFEKDDEDISITYGWPPLICCFGAAQHAFLPSGRPANRLLNYEIHRSMKDALWAPEKFFRAPGGSAGSVAIALGSTGAKVAFMGKLGDDDFGEAMLYYLNVSKVQTRSVRIDKRRPTAVSRVKIVKRGNLRISMGKPCAEDSLAKSEINIDVLKEAKMFYCNTFSLLDQNMRKTTVQALKISKKLGGVIFYDLNLPMPLWQSCDETKEFIQEVWDLADIIEVTKQELEFLCGITPTEEFDTEHNDKSKFVHYEPGVLAPLFHEQLKILFVTNGTSKVHYYTKEHNGFVRGMEDPPITPFTRDMSAAGDGIVAGLMRMLVLQLHLITDKGYLEQSIKYAISCGVTSQWLLGRKQGFPPKEGLEEEVAPDLDGIISLTEKQFRRHPDAKVPDTATVE